jgi:Rhodopirellula transposase DDE domain
MTAVTTLAVLREKYDALAPIMDERLHRLWAASEALALGWGGTTLVAQATGLSQTTIRAGIAELKDPHPLDGEGAEEPARIRRRGGGRKPLSQTDQTLCRDLTELVDPATRGDPQSPLCWTCKSTRRLAAALVKKGHQVSHQTVERLLGDMDYSLQANRKTRDGSSHPDRNAQFEHIASKVRSFQRRGQPVISVDTKKKELVGDFKNAGREWQPQGKPEQVRSKDFKDKKLGKVAPYGVYDLTANQGWVSVGIDHDTAEFATESIRRWWQQMGSRVYPRANSLLVTADGGGSNSSRSRLWKVALQKLADALGLRITICHFPPGTSKWNKIEHRMFCHITENWRGKPLVSRAVIVSLIGSTTTRTGLRVKAELDTNLYAKGIKVSDADLAAVKMKKETFHGEWNYTIVPNH